MTDANTTGEAPELSSFIQIWVDSLAQVLVQIAPALFTAAPDGGAASPVVGVDQAPAEVPPQDSRDLWMLGVCSGQLRGETSLRVPAASIRRLAGIFTGETAEGAPASEPGPDEREAVVELLRQIAGFVATAATAQWGEVQLRLDTSEAAPSWPASSTVWLRVGGNPSTTALVEIHISAALAAALRSESARAAAVPAEPPAATAAAPTAGSSPVTAQPVKADTKENGQVGSQAASKVQLDLLLDVELGVILRFGGRRLALREVLDLIPGMVIELDRHVEEPVDMLLDGRVVARGEVVVMDGNYGLRVTEVAPSTNA